MVYHVFCTVCEYTHFTKKFLAVCVFVFIKGSKNKLQEMHYEYNVVSGDNNCMNCNVHKFSKP